MFNGFFISRMIYGQLTFHAFMLLPLVSFLLLEPAPQKSLFDHLSRSAWAALPLGYMFYAGMVHGLPPVLLAIVIIALIHGLMFNNLKIFALRFMITGVIALALCAMKLLPALSYLDEFGRTGYKLGGVADLWQLLKLVISSLVGTVDLIQAQQGLSNSQWRLAEAEFLYDVGLVPIVIIVTAVAIVLYQRRFFKPTACSLATISVIALLLTVPLALNYYQPDWNALLKSLPVIENSMTLLRWFLVYIPIIILVAAIIIEKTPPLQRWRTTLLLITVISVTAAQPWIDRGFENRDRYQPHNIIQSYHQLNQWQPQVTQIVYAQDPYGRPLPHGNRNDMLSMGASQISCYEPMFGYRLESFPIKSLHIGNILDNSHGTLNLKNPACYIYPDSNHCVAGDHFTVEQQAQLLSFSRYQKFDYQQPWWQTIANWLSLFTLIGIVIIGGIHINRSFAESHGSQDNK
jgi:hypothetical protein